MVGREKPPSLLLLSRNNQHAIVLCLTCFPDLSMLFSFALDGQKTGLVTKLVTVTFNFVPRGLRRPYLHVSLTESHSVILTGLNC